MKQQVIATKEMQLQSNKFTDDTAVDIPLISKKLEEGLLVKRDMELLTLAEHLSQ